MKRYVNDSLEPTWKIAKRKICDARSADLQCDAVLRKAELRFKAIEIMVVSQEITAWLVWVQNSELSTSDPVLYLRLVGDNCTELLIASLA